MSADKPYPAPPDATSHLPPRRKRRYIPPVWVWGVAIVCAAIIGLLRWRVEAFDHAVVNIVTVVLSFFVFLIATFWFLFASAYPALLRVAVVFAGLFALILLGFFFPLDHVDGALVPRFRYRFAPKPDELLEKPAPVVDEGVKVDLATTSASDFPEFLGPGRLASVAGPPEGLARDWQANPPEVLWKQPIGSGWSAFSAVNGYAVTLEQRGTDELVTCYEARTGKLMWSHGVEARHTNIMGGTGPRSTPTIHEGQVYALGATGVLHCLDGATGRPAWPSKDLLKMMGSSAKEDEAKVMWGRSNSPLVVANLVVVPFGGKGEGPYSSLIAFDKNTGAEVWRGGNRNVSYSSPILATFHDIQQILIVNEDTVSSHDPQNGQEFWSHAWPGHSNSDANSSQVVPLAPDEFFVSKAYGAGASRVQVKLDKGNWSTEQLWNNKSVLKTKFTNVVVGGTAVFGLSDGILECVDLAEGKRQWKSGRYGQGQILGVGEMLLVQAESGEVVLCAANPERFVELARVPAIEGVTWNNLCLHGRLLLVRNSNEAACLELPVASK